MVTKQNDSSASIDSGLPIDEGSEEETENHEDDNVVFQPPNPLLNRAKSLNYKRAATSNESKLSSLGKYKIPEDQRFSLQFGDQTSDRNGERSSDKNEEKSEKVDKTGRGTKPEKPPFRSSRDSIKLILSLNKSPKQLMFYQFNDNSDESLSSEDGSSGSGSEDEDSKFVWFGQNRRKD